MAKEAEVALAKILSQLLQFHHENVRTIAMTVSVANYARTGAAILATQGAHPVGGKNAEPTGLRYLANCPLGIEVLVTA